MNNKLSELSKPAWIVGEKEIADFMRGDEALLVREHDPESTEPALRMYSQEYVSALLAELDGMAQTLNVANDATRIWKERALAAEAKLATPVRLLGEMQVHDWEHRVDRQAAFEHRKIAWDARLAEDKKAILAAGFTFTVEGDE